MRIARKRSRIEKEENDQKAEVKREMLSSRERRKKGRKEQRKKGRK